MLFCLRTLVPQIPDLKILDLTIGYPGVPRGGYAQEWYVALYLLAFGHVAKLWYCHCIANSV